MAINHEVLDVIYENHSSTIARDLKLNLKRLLTESALSPEEATITLLATATSVGDARLAAHAREQLASVGLPDDQIREAAESAAMMGMLNTYYRFKHMVGPRDGKEEEYRTAGLRMTALARPALGKERFEMLAFAVSVLNGCEMCIRSHEQALRGHGLTVDKIHDLARIAAVVKGLSALA